MALPVLTRCVCACLCCVCVWRVRTCAIDSVSDTTGAFALMAGFPPAPLTDSGATLEAAGLLNSNVRMNLL